MHVPCPLIYCLTPHWFGGHVSSHRLSETSLGHPLAWIRIDCHMHWQDFSDCNPVPIQSSVFFPFYLLITFNFLKK